MEVARERSRSHGDLLVLEVVTRGEVDVPAIADLYAATHIKTLRKAVRITHGVIIELALRTVFTHTDVITYTEVPGYVESHIAVFIGLGLVATLLTGAVLGFLHLLIHIGVEVVIPFLVLALALLVFLLIHLLAPETLDEVQPTTRAMLPSSTMPPIMFM